MSQPAPDAQPDRPDIAKPDVPKPDIPKPDIPKPDIPKPDIPKPDIPQPASDQPLEPPVLTPRAGTGPIHLRIAEETADPTTANGAPAAFNPRFLAGLIDLVVVVVIYLLLPKWPAGGIALLVAAAYWLARDCLGILGGQSIGKRVIGLKVLTVEDQSLVGNWQAGIIRNLALLPLLPLEMYVLMARDDQGRRGIRLGDQWAHTKVVIHRRQAPPQEDSAAS